MTWKIASWCPLPLVAIHVNKELWNHPRCWSVPSRYKSAGKPRPFLFPNTAAQEEPGIGCEKLRNTRFQLKGHVRWIWRDFRTETTHSRTKKSNSQNAYRITGYFSFMTLLKNRQLHYQSQTRHPLYPFLSHSLMHLYDIFLEVDPPQSCTTMHHCPSEIL